jgi:hypothetical protein
MVAVYICYHFTGSDSDNVIIPLTDGSCVYMFSFKEVVLILLSFLSLMTAVYICSLLQEVGLILLSFLSLMAAVYICSLLQEVVLILLSFLSLMVAVYLFSLIGSGSHIVIIPLTDGSCVYMLSFYRKYFSYCYHSPC